LWVFHLNFSLNIGTTGSHVAHESLNQVPLLYYAWVPISLFSSG
jgi:hypothetical protein